MTMPLISTDTTNTNKLKNGQLWIVAIPLGNLDDLSPRARMILENADLVLAEDTRRAGLFFQRASMKSKGFISLHDHNEEKRCQEVITLLEQGKCLALISDAGTPILSDPGFRLVQACRRAGINVSIVPGPCAPIAALMGAGIAPQPFTFLGFLPREKTAIEKSLSPFISFNSTIVFFERKDRLQATLALAYNLLGSRQLCIAREMTKTFEEFIVMNLEDYKQLSIELKGEITVVIGPALQIERTSQNIVENLLAEEQEKGGKLREVCRRVQDQVQGWTSKEIYLLYHSE